MATRNSLTGWWTTEMVDPPRLTTWQWNLTGLLGVLLVVAAILQAISFSDFKGWFEGVGISEGVAGVLAVSLIVAELWAAISMFKLRMMPWFRTAGVYLALLASGFWFVETIRQISNGSAGRAENSGFFGSFLEFSPGWWSVIGVTLVLFWVVYSAGLLDRRLTTVATRARTR